MWYNPNLLQCSEDMQFEIFQNSVPEKLLPAYTHIYLFVTKKGENVLVEAYVYMTDVV